MGLEDKTMKIFAGNSIKIEVTRVVEPLTLSEAREIYPYRPYSKYAESRHGGDIHADDETLLKNGIAKRCSMCQAPTKLIYLSPDCPDCNGFFELLGFDPREKINKINFK
jgi:hypothetical protein